MARSPSSRQSASPRSAWIRVLGLAVVLVAAAVGTRAALSGNTEAPTVDQALDNVFLERGVDRARLFARKPEAGADAAVAEVSVALPAGETYSRLNADVKRAVEAAGGSVLDVVELGPIPERPASLEIELGEKGDVTHRVTVHPEPGLPKKDPNRAAPRVALVFDDLGYTMEGLAAELLAIDAPLTFAILPGLARSTAFAEEARRRGHDVILHLPMEPLDRAHHDPGENSLDPALEAEENLTRLRANLDALPFYSGVSNHMGSRATADASLMDLVLNEVRSRDRSLFVLDSRTTPYSVLPERAGRAGVRCVANNLFLDANEEDGSVAGMRIARVESIAKRYGQAIAIGHVRRDTIDAVKTAVDEWQQAGIRLVPLSDLMHR